MNKPTLEQAKTLLAAILQLDTMPLAALDLLHAALSGSYQDGAIDTLTDVRKSFNNLSFFKLDQEKDMQDKGTPTPEMLNFEGI